MALQILGGKSSFDHFIYLVRPCFPPRETLYRIIDQLDQTRFLTNNGYYVQKLEEALEAYLGVPHVVLTSSSTLGLQLLVRALDLKGEVIVPSFTFVATPHSLVWEGLRPVFADIETNCFSLDPAALPQVMAEEVSAVMGVHLFGNPCDIAGLDNFCRDRKIPLLFDAAQALGSTYHGKKIGGFGAAEVFSLHATKIIHSLEGGFVATHDEALAKKIKSMRNFGFAGYDQVEGLGINAKMNEFSAAVGLENLKLLPEVMRKNQQNHQLYARLLSQVPGVRPFRTRAQSETNYNSYPVVIEDSFGLSRDQLCDIFYHENVLVRRYYYPGCHRHEPYLNGLGRRGKLNQTEEMSEKILSLPCYPDLGEEAIAKIVSIFVQAAEQAARLKAYYDKNPRPLKLIPELALAPKN